MVVFFPPVAHVATDSQQGELNLPSPSPYPSVVLLSLLTMTMSLHLLSDGEYVDTLGSSTASIFS